MTASPSRLHRLHRAPEPGCHNLRRRFRISAGRGPHVRAWRSRPGALPLPPLASEAITCSRKRPLSRPAGRHGGDGLPPDVDIVVVPPLARPASCLPWRRARRQGRGAGQQGGAGDGRHLVVAPLASTARPAPHRQRAQRIWQCLWAKTGPASPALSSPASAVLRTSAKTTSTCNSRRALRHPTGRWPQSDVEAPTLLNKRDGLSRAHWLSAFL